MRAERFTDRDGAAWEAVRATSPHGTLFHDRRFLAYHGTRFHSSECSVVWHEQDAPVAVMPMALAVEGDRRVARSPFGGSVGGPMFAVRPRYRTCTDALAALHLLLAEQDVHDLHITLPPAIWHREPDDTMRFAMLEAGFVSTGRDVHSVVPLGSFTGFGSGSRVGRSVRRADTDGVSIQRDAPLTAFATVLDATFRKHGTTPTHTPAELAWLVEHLPTQVRVHVAWMAGHPVAGIAEFLVAPHVRQAFYLAQDPAYQQHQALSRLIVDALTHARDDGFAYYDFGTSSVEQQARTGVLEFKETFGATLHSRERLIWRRDARPRG